MRAIEHPTRVVRFNLLAMILALAYSASLQDLVKNSSPELLMATVAFFLTSLNFFHGKVVTLEDRDYNLALIDRPMVALADFVLNTAVFVGFTVMSLTLDTVRGIVLVNIGVRAVDALLVLMIRSLSLEPRVRRAQGYWLGMDLSMIALLIVFYMNQSWLVSKVGLPAYFIAASLFLVLTILDLALDYSINRKLYFSIAGTWASLASLWDEAQGRHGDIYRHAVMLPAIRDHVPKEAVVLDAGCGNGCVSRALAERGASVIAVEKYEEMLAVARAYGSGHITYVKADIENALPAEMRERFDSVLAIFTLQDAERLRHGMRSLSETLAATGKLIIVAENETAFNDIRKGRPIQRRWLSSAKHAGKGRKQLLVWGATFVKTASIAPPQTIDEDLEHTTVTRHWRTGAYIQAARECGLELVVYTDEMPVVDDSITSHALVEYGTAPTLQLMAFAKRDVARANQAETNSGNLELWLVAGVPGCGKTKLCQALKLAIVVSVDDFSLDIDDPNLPRVNGKPDWESPLSINMKELNRAVQNLAAGLPADVPTYSMATSLRTGTRRIDPAGSTRVVVEGTHAFDVACTTASSQVRVLVRSSSWLSLGLAYFAKLRKKIRQSDFVAPLWLRRVQRDMHEKRRSLLIELPYVLWLSLQDWSYNRRAAGQADTVVENNGSPGTVVERLVGRINTGSALDDPPK